MNAPVAGSNGELLETVLHHVLIRFFSKLGEPNVRIDAPSTPPPRTHSTASRRHSIYLPRLPRRPLIQPLYLPFAHTHRPVYVVPSHIDILDLHFIVYALPYSMLYVCLSRRLLIPV